MSRHVTNPGHAKWPDSEAPRVYRGALHLWPSRTCHLMRQRVKHPAARSRQARHRFGAGRIRARGDQRHRSSARQPEDHRRHVFVAGNVRGASRPSRKRDPRSRRQAGCIWREWLGPRDSFPLPPRRPRPRPGQGLALGNSIVREILRASGTAHVRYLTLQAGTGWRSIRCCSAICARRLFTASGLNVDADQKLTCLDG